MPKGFRPTLEPSKHRKAVVEARRPALCLFVTSIIIFLVFAIFGLSAWNVYAHRFDQNQKYFHPRDEVSLSEVSNDLSSTFCDGYRVSLQNPGLVFLLPRRAEVSMAHPDPMSIEMHQAPNHVLNVKTAYLLTGSIVNVTACRERSASPLFAKIILIRGESNLQSWRKDNGCNSCVLKHVIIPEEAFCDNRGGVHEAKLTHTIRDNDRYYLVVFFGRPQNLHHMPGPGILLKGVFMRTHYNVANAERVCNTTSCVFDLPWRSGKDVIVRFEGPPWENNVLITKCETRIVFWVCLFGILPIVCVIPISFIFGWFLCRRTRRNAQILRQKLEEKRRKGIVNIVTHNEDYGSVAIQDG